MKKIPKEVLDEMWQYFLTTSAYPKLLEKKMKEKEKEKSEARIEQSEKE